MMEALSKFYRNLKFEFNVLRFKLEQDISKNPGYSEWLALGVIIGIIIGALV